MNGDLIYTKTIRFAYSDFDTYDHILPSSLQRFFQDIAGEQCDKLNVGYLDLLKQDALWIVSKMQIDFFYQLKYDEDYIFKTWPLKRRMFYFPREFEISDKKGNVIVRCISTWHIFSNSDRKLINPKNMNLSGLDKAEENQSFYENWNIDILKEYETQTGQNMFSHKVMFTELDHNGHLNNTHYSDIALNSLPEHHKNEFLSQMKIIFLSECKLNDIINTIFFKDSDSDVIRGEKNEHPVFIAMFKYGEKNGK